MNALRFALPLLLVFPALAEAGVQEDLAATRRFYRAGKYTEALTKARLILRADPSSAEAAVLAQNARCALDGRADLEKEIPEGAPAALRSALEARLVSSKASVAALLAVLSGESAQELFRLDVALARHTMGMHSAAEADMRKYLQVYPEDPDAHALLGVILAARKKARDARASFERALALCPGHASAAVPFAAFLAERDDASGARSVLKGALAVHPQHPGLLVGLSDDHLRLREWDDAVKTLTSVLRLDVDKAPVHARLAEVHHTQKDAARAESAARTALALDPNEIRALRVLGLILQKRDDFAGAMDQFVKAKKARPDRPQVHVDIAFLLIIQNKLIYAERAIKEALAIDKYHVDANAKLGVLLYRRERYKDAKKPLALALKKEADHIPANRYMGYTLLAEGKAKNAMKYFRRVSELDESDSKSVRMIGRCLYDAGKFEDAIESFRAAIGRDGKDPWNYFDLGKGLERLERWEDAEAAYRKAVELGPEFVFVRYYLAVLLDDVVDNVEEALEHYKKYVELGGKDTDKSVRDRIKQIEQVLEDEK